MTSYRDVPHVSFKKYVMLLEIKTCCNNLSLTGAGLLILLLYHPAEICNRLAIEYMQMSK